MILLREVIEADLAVTLEGEFRLPVILISPDGVRQDKSANDPEADLVGQIIYDTHEETPDTGGDILIHKPVVTLRRTSLNRIPVSGEKWAVEIPIVPKYTATKEKFFMEVAEEDGGAIGFIRLYLMRVKQV